MDNLKINGITPAHAGKRKGPARCPRGGWDHPRTCGEKHQYRSVNFQKVGSPPHMRGKEWWIIELTGAAGITPAHAGKSFRLAMTILTRRDHPRTCGEKLPRYLSGYAIQGSPPHMRGKEVNFIKWQFQIGITPAHAGKRDSVGHSSNFARDHPRTCGEKIQRN